ncbi:MAG: hypothetical protein LC746_01295 [Acidobacteria bacterium]|nr:hypothetical protein [Acidobacteriota bacterium]
MQKTIRWRWGVVAAALLAVVSLVPQAALCRARGREWRGAYAYFYSDEPAYAAYLNALIEGRPRRNDPYTGADDSTGAPPHESLFSIQFLPAYLLAVPARALRLSAGTVFILLMPLVAMLCSLAIYYVGALVARDERAACAAVFVALCLGIVVSGDGFISEWLRGDPGYVFLPFLRRYVPGVPLVFFFAYCAALLRALTDSTPRARNVSALAAGLLFAALVYSYFYHWTAAAAITALFGALHLLARPEERRGAARSLVIIGSIAAVSLVPYLLLVSRRAPSTDTAQALARTHAPDLLRGVELLAALTLAALAVAARRRRINPRDRACLFTAALAVSVLAVFNQQVLTGLSLQPMHYEQYVGNYVALLAATLAATLIWQGRARVRLVPHKLWVPVALFALAWGLGETVSTTRAYAAQNARHDDWLAVARRLDALARNAPRGATAEPHPVVFNPDDFRMDHVPAESACAVVWAPHMFTFADVSRAESRARVFQFLHFSGVAPAAFAAEGRDQAFLQFSLFGWERANPRLAVEFHPVTVQEIADAQSDYARYVAALGQNSRPPRPVINFVVASDDQPFSRANLERFYTLTPIERVGIHTIYRATVKQP